MPVIDMKAVGRRRKLFDDFSVPLPPGDGDGSRSLRDVIEHIVREEVAAFETRQRDNQFVRALSPAEIEQAAERGKIDSGGSEREPQTVDVDDAVANALLAFEDGFYFVIVDGQQLRSLDTEVRLAEDSRITFLRLTPLAGG